MNKTAPNIRRVVSFKDNENTNSSQKQCIILSWYTNRCVVISHSDRDPFPQLQVSLVQRPDTPTWTTSQPRSHKLSEQLRSVEYPRNQLLIEAVSIRLVGHASRRSRPLHQDRVSRRWTVVLQWLIRSCTLYTNRISLLATLCIHSFIHLSLDM